MVNNVKIDVPTLNHFFSHWEIGWWYRSATSALFARLMRWELHSPVSCTFARRIWEMFLSSFNKAWLNLTNAKDGLGKDLILEHNCMMVKWIHEHLPKAIIWVLWIVRNWRVFEDKGKDLHNIIADIRDVMYDWSRGKVLFKSLILLWGGTALWDENAFCILDLFNFLLIVGSCNPNYFLFEIYTS